MKTVTISERSKHKLLHIEAPGCIVNITVGLTDSSHHAITAVHIKCDESGEESSRLPDFGDTTHLGVRVRMLKPRQ